MRRPGMVVRSGAGSIVSPCAASSAKPAAPANPLAPPCCGDFACVGGGGIVDMLRSWPKLKPLLSTMGCPMTPALRLFAFALALATLAGAATAQTLEQVKVGTTNVASDVAIFIAEQKGYFRDEGIAVTTASFASAAKMIAPLGTGELDAGGGTVAAGLYNAVERGINIKVVADKASVAEGYEYST